MESSARTPSTPPASYLRRAGARGHANYGWLDSRHSFSFGNYFDAAHMGFARLRVINEDQVAPGEGFGTHGHESMEIVTYVLSGSLAHRDSLGNGSVIVPGDVQRMSAGRGVRHSEFNPSDSEPVRFLQIWLTPDAPGGEPGYEQGAFALDGPAPQLLLSPEGRAGSLSIGADVDLYAARLKAVPVAQRVAANRAVWVQMVAGEATVAGETLHAGDGIGLAAQAADWTLTLTSPDEAHVLIFDMANEQEPHA